MPDYVKNYGFRSPDDVLSGPYQFTHGIREETYVHWQSQPDVISNFDTFMKGGKLNDKGRWWDWLSVDEVLLDDFRPSEDAVLLVDVGGGRGHDLKAFRTKHPYARGRFILQDLPEVIEQIVDLDESVERMSYRFLIHNRSKVGFWSRMLNHPRLTNVTQVPEPTSFKASSTVGPRAPAVSSFGFSLWR